MPNRILKESITTSENIDKLTAFQETVFYRLIVICDDFGRADARPKLLASKLFPLKDIRPAQIEDALRGLTSAELVRTYTVGGKPFLQMKTWDRHQQVRNKVSKFPSPEEADEEDLQAIDSNCNQLQSNDSKCPRNPIQSYPNPIRIQSESNTRRRARETDFDRFWEAYPKKVGKADARKAFLRTDDPVDTMIEALDAQKRSDQWQRDGGRYIPNPATWLNQGRWDDVLPESHHGYQRHGDAPTPAMLAAVKQMLEEDDNA